MRLLRLLYLYTIQRIGIMYKYMHAVRIFCCCVYVYHKIYTIRLTAQVEKYTNEYDLMWRIVNSYTYLFPFVDILAYDRIFAVIVSTHSYERQVWTKKSYYQHVP